MYCRKYKPEIQCFTSVVSRSRIGLFLLMAALMLGFTSTVKASIPEYARNHVTDSLERAMTGDISDSLRMNLMLEMIRNMAPREPYVAMDYAKKALLYSEQINHKYAKAKILTLIGAIYQVRAEYNKALAWFFIALKFGENEPFYPMIKGISLNNIAICYSYLNQYALAEKYLKEALQVKLDSKMYKELGVTYTNLADLTMRQGKIMESIAYCKKAIESDREHGVKESGTVYLNLGDAYLQLKQYAASEKYFLYGLKLELKENDKHRLSECYYALGKFYLERNDFDKASQNLFEAARITENSGILIAKADIYKLIAEMYLKERDFSNAYRYNEKYHAAKDSVMNEDVAKQINELQVRYDIDKKDNEIRTLNQNSQLAEAKARSQRFLTNFLTAAVVFILIIIFVLWRNIVLKQRVNSILEEKNDQLSEQNVQIEQQKLQIEEVNNRLNLFNKELSEENIAARYEILKSKTNPHFLFNSMSTLSAIVVDDQQLALEFIDRFSQLYRKILETGDMELISLEEELSIVKNYLYLQQMKFGDNMHVTIHMPAGYEQYNLPPFALQMVVENAFKHNMISSSHQLYISISVEGGLLIVKNNLQQRLSRLQSTGTGQKNIIGRYKILSDIQPGFVMTETEYIVTLPLLRKAGNYPKAKEA